MDAIQSLFSVKTDIKDIMRTHLICIYFSVCNDPIDKLDPIGQSITDLLNPKNERKIVEEGKEV